MNIRKIPDALRSMFSFTPSQVRGILLLLPMLAVFGVIIGLADKPRFEKSFLELADSAAVSSTRGSYTSAPYPDSGNTYNRKPAIVNENPGDAPKPFDPNHLDAAGFVALGFSPKQADVIVRYRYSIGGFKSKEDFAKCYVVSDKMMELLGPYIRITVPVAHEPAGRIADGPASVGLMGTEPLSTDPMPIAPARIEINSADSAVLRQVRGIGDVLVVRIIEYRARLGGFASATQLAEVRGMSEGNLQRICEQIRVDSCGIQKIDVNFAPHKTLVGQLGNHPYATGEMLRKLLKNRQLKGGWRTIGEMVEQDIMTGEEAERLSPYLLFRSE